MHQKINTATGAGGGKQRPPNEQKYPAPTKEKKKK
jgi:hypothetical protein